MKNYWKHFILITAFVAVLLASAVFMSGCNRQVVDLTYTYNYAIIELPNGEVVEGFVQSWRDYEDGDQLQVKIDGDVYLVHSSDVALIKKR